MDQRPKSPGHKQDLDFIGSVFQVDQQGSKVTYLGSGFLIAPDMLLTCSHVVADGHPGNMYRTYQQADMLDPAQIQVQTSAGMLPAVLTITPHAQLDMALVTLKSPVTCLIPPLLRKLGPSLEARLKTSQIKVHGYPDQENGGTQRHYPVTIKTIGFGNSDTPSLDAQVDSGVLEGMSGGPVLVHANGHTACLGIVYLGGARAASSRFITSDQILSFMHEQGIEPVKWVDGKALFPALIKEIDAHSKTDHIIVKGITALSADYADRILKFQAEYLGTPEQRISFGGRGKAFAELDAWFDDPRQPPKALLAAPAGRGKSALLVRWCQQLLQRNDLEVVMFPVSSRFRTNLASVVFASLSARLATLHGEAVPGGPDTSDQIWRAMMKDYLARPLPDGQRLLLILDGIDEAADWEAGPELFPMDLPKSTRVLLSAREGAGGVAARPWLRQLGWDRPGMARDMNLPALTPEGIADVLNKMGCPLDQLGANVDIVTTLHHLSEGDPLLVGLYVDDLWARKDAVARLQPEDLQHIPPGLEGYFERWWDDQRRLWGHQAPLKEPAVQALMNVLACALSPLRQDDILDKLAPPEAQLTTWTLDEALRLLERLVICIVIDTTGELGYTFSHPRLNAYFWERLTAKERQAVESRFLEWGKGTLKALNKGRLSPKDVSPYLIQHYGVHLQRTDSGAKAYLSLVSDGWRRAWYELEGAYAGFLNDVKRAWTKAEAVDLHASETDELLPYLGDEVKCMLCFASVNALASNIPPELLCLLVENNLMTPIQALAYARLSGSTQRVQSLIYLAPRLPESQRCEFLSEALAAARAIHDKFFRARALTKVAPHLPESQRGEVLSEALAAARAIYRNEDSKIRALTGLAPHLPETLLSEARAHYGGYRALTLTGLAPHLPQSQRGEVLSEALAAARAIYCQFFRARALTKVAPHLPETQRGEVLSEALAAARAINPIHYEFREESFNYEYERARALTGLAPHLPESERSELLSVALAAARAIQEEFLRVRPLTKLAPHLPESQREEVLSEALATARAIRSEDSRAWALTRLAPHLPETLLSEALAAAQAIHDEFFRAQARTGLAPHLPESERGEVLAEALAEARTIHDEFFRARALTRLAPHLPESQREEVLSAALAAARAIHDEVDRARALTGLAHHLPQSQRGELLTEALAAARAIYRNEDSKIRALTGLVPHLPESERGEPLSEALAAARAIQGVDARVKALTGLAHHLPQSQRGQVLTEALAAARTIHDEERRAWVLTELAPHLPESERSELLSDALAAARAIHHEPFRAPALTRLAPHLPETLLSEALAAARAIQGVARVQALTGLAHHLPQSQRGQVLTEALAAARPTHGEKALAWALTKLAPHLPETLLTKALAAARATHGKEARARARALTELAPHLPETLLSEALAAAPAIHNEADRAMVLTQLAPHLPESQRGEVLSEALAAARAIDSGYDRTKALTGLAPHLPESERGDIVSEVLAAAQAIHDEFFRAQALTQLAPHLPESERGEVLSEALAAARAIHDEERRAWVLTELAPHLPETLLTKALAAARAFHDEELRAKALTGLSRHLANQPVSKCYPLCNELMHGLADCRRQSIIGDFDGLMMLISLLGGDKAVHATFRAIRDVGQWWP